MSLLEILNAEGGSFERLDYSWRPKNLFFELQTKDLLADMLRRQKNLSTAIGEFQRLDRMEFYLKQVRKITFIIRRAKFVRQSNHLAFGQAVSEFYTAYGQILRYLKIDQARGVLVQKPKI